MKQKKPLESNVAVAGGRWFLCLTYIFSNTKEREKKSRCKQWFYPAIHAYRMLAAPPFARWSCWLLLLYLDGRRVTGNLGAASWEQRRGPKQMEAANTCHTGCHQPQNFNKEFFLTNFFSRETLLLITVSLSCNEVQVFKVGLEKCSQLIKVYFAPKRVLFPLPAQGQMLLWKTLMWETLVKIQYLWGLFSPFALRKDWFFFNKVELKMNGYLYILRNL